MFGSYYLLLTAIAITGIVSSALLQPWGPILIGISLLSLLGLRKIPEDPPHVAIRTVWGKRTDEISGEGLVLTANFFPLFLSFVLIEVTYQNLDFSFDKIRCRLKTKPRKATKTGTPQKPKSGGSVSAIIALTIEPDYRSSSNSERLRQYLNAGGAEGVKDILSDMLVEALRHEGTYRSWEDMVFGKNRLSAIFITALTGEPIPRAKRDDNDDVLRDSTGKITILEGSYVEPYEAHELEVEHFLKTALTNGVSDVHGLGIVIRRLNVKEVVPEGNLLDDAERPARELIQLSTETFDTKTDIVLAKLYVKEAKKRDEKMDLETALRIVRVNRKRATEILINPHQEKGDPLDSLVAAAIVASGNGERSNS